MRLTASTFLTIALLLGACGDGETPPVGRASGTIERSTVGGAVGEGTSGSIEASSPEGTSATVAGQPGPGSVDAHERTVASAAETLQRYFDALGTQDFAAAQSVSSGPARFMARIREVVSAYNAEREGTSSLSYAKRSFDVRSAEAATVAYVGAAQLDLTVSGPAGDPYEESALFEDPLVTFVEGSWHLSSFTYDGRPMGHYPSTSSTSVGGVELRLHGALNFGVSTGVIVDLTADGDHDIRVDGAQLHYPEDSTTYSTFGALSSVGSALYFLFDRVDSKPLSWTATVTLDAGTEHETTQDVVLEF